MPEQRNATKLTKAQAGRLGGLKAARALGVEGVRRRGSHGGATTLDRYGKEHMTRLAHRSHGRDVKLVTEAPIDRAP